MAKYVYCEHFKDGHEVRQEFDTPAEAIGFANMHYAENPDVLRAYVVESFNDDLDMEKWVNGKEIKVLKDC
ncbi:MAG: hypothetical protein Q4B73_06120 [Lachnospiraceae bacterium]|nr:hypothetical protein [Lachnospiraceae bacterium]